MLLIVKKHHRLIILSSIAILFIVGIWITFSLWFSMYSYTRGTEVISFQYPSRWNIGKELSKSNSNIEIISKEGEDDGVLFSFKSTSSKRKLISCEQMGPTVTYCNIQEYDNYFRQDISWVAEEENEISYKFEAVYSFSDHSYTLYGSYTAEKGEESFFMLKEVEYSVRSLSYLLKEDQEAEYYKDISLKNESIKDESVTKEPSQDSYVDSFNCFEFLNAGNYTDPSTFFLGLNPASLEQLAKDWSWGSICESLDSRQLFVVSVNKVLSAEVDQGDALRKSEQNYPSLSSAGSLETEYEYYQFFAFTNRDIEITSGSLKKTFEKGKLYPITNLVWAAALAGCMIEPGNYISNNGVIISCGYGDNGCANIERVKWNLLTGESEYLSSCENNCDLAEDQPSTLICQ